MAEYDDNMTSHYDMSFLKRSISEMNLKSIPDYSDPMKRIQISKLYKGRKMNNFLINSNSDNEFAKSRSNLSKVSSSVISSDSSIASRISRYKLAKEEEDKE